MNSSKKRIVSIFALVLLLFFFVVALFFLFDINKAFWPTSASIKKARAELEQAQISLKTKVTELSGRRKTRRDFLKQSPNYWISARDGQLEEVMMRRIEDAAKNSKILLNNFGNTKSSKLNEQFSFFDFTIDAKAPMEDISRFMVEIYKSRPCFYWTRCVLRPSKPNDSKDITLSASLRVLYIDDEKIAKRLMEEKSK